MKLKLDNFSFMSYPEIIEKDFNEKIYLKKEFRDTEIIERDKDLTKKRDFTLEPQQIFLRNYISPDTPYNGILVFWKTGTGKTCAAISIAEGFKNTLKNMNKKMLVITTIPENFRKEIYNFEKERHKINPEDVIQCTGREYELGEESLYLTQQQREKEVLKMIKSYYQFFGYTSFANYITENTGGWKGDEKDINEKIKNFISNEFDERVIIIDEIQNIKTDKRDLTKIIQPILQAIIKYGKNIKLVLMSATPMFDRPDEIIFYINLLLENDGREKINKNDIFNSKDGTLKNGADQILRKIFTGYVSYIRAEKPYIFPFRIYPKESVVPHVEYYINGKKIDKEKRIKYTKLVLCEMKGIQEKTYEYYLNTKIKENEIENIHNEENVNEDENENNLKDKRILHDLIYISNITFPLSNENENKNIGSISKMAVEADYDNGLGGYYKSVKMIGSKKRIQFKYQSHAIFNKDTSKEKPFADEDYLNKYSTKFASLLETVKKSKGLIYIYSNFISQGVLPLALMLEQNGFDRECIEGEDQLLDYNVNKYKGGGKRRQICYWCGNDAKFKDHHNEKAKDFHYFKRAKYIIYYPEQSEIIKVKKEEALKKFIDRKNKYGEDIKIFIGTKAVSEGLDFKMLRQVHILEPWYNLSRHEQIIGRAIRNHSHFLLLPEERNVEIYQYASILPPKSKYSDRESVDLKNYRLSENKDVIIKKITRIMKESAVDCVLFKKMNIIDSNKKEKQITSSGEVIYVNIADKPYSQLCDYEGNCKYTCNWEPNPRKKYPINTDTYNLSFSASDIMRIKKEIKLMFRYNIVYHLNTIEKYIFTKFIDVDKLFIYTALEELVNNRNEIVYDRFSRKGYIIYRGDYYVFQPFDLERDDLPLIYRMYPESYKPKNVNLENVIVDYNINSNTNLNNNNRNINNEELYEKFLMNIEVLFNTYHKEMTENKKYLIYAIIGYLIDKMNEIQQIILYKIILIKYLQKDNEKYLDDIILYLNLKNKLINFYSEISFDKSKIKNNFFVGFIINDKYFIIESIDKIKSIKDIKINKIKIISCPKEIILKIKAYRNIGQKNKNKNANKNYNIIHGLIEIDYTKKTNKFKIVDKSVEENIFTKEKQKSKRSIITGRICSTYQINKLIEMRKIVGLPTLNSKKKVDFYCEELEIYFRYKQLLKSDNKIWFVETIV